MIKNDLEKLAPVALRFAPMALELMIIAVFLYAGYLINSAFNPTIDFGGGITKGRVIFDKEAISAVKKLNEPLIVSGLPEDGANPFDR